MTPAPAWSAPDEAGVRSLPLRGRSVLEQRRRRRADRGDPGALALLPAHWVALVREWLGSESATRRWKTLLGQAGSDRIQAAEQVCTALLEAGWIELEERRDRDGHWHATRVHWLDRSALRIALGLGDPAALDAAAARLVEDGFSDPRLPALADTLAGRPAALRLRRLELLQAVDRWVAAARTGSRRQFAHFARGDTKAVTDDEWRWLDDALSLQGLGIEGHRPGFWLRGPLQLRLPGGVLALDAAGDAIALTPATLLAVQACTGGIGCWRIVENRTSFEQAALAHGHVDGVVWVPGFPADWWRACMGTLLDRAPARVRIACDPDPAGIRIALCVAGVCEAAGADWSPWKMAGTDLRGLVRTRALGDYDRAELARLRATPASAPFADLIRAMDDTGSKGEQEGLVLG